MIKKFQIQESILPPPVWWRECDDDEIPDYVLNRETGTEIASVTKNGFTFTIKTPTKSKKFNRQGDKFITYKGVTKRTGYWMDFPEDGWKLTDEQYYNLPLKERMLLECEEQFKYDMKATMKDADYKVVDIDNYTIDDSINENDDSNIPKYKLVGGTVYQKWMKFENPLTKGELLIVIKNITGVDQIDVKEAQGLTDRYIIFAKNQGCIGYYYIAKQTLHIDKIMLNKP